MLKLDHLYAGYGETRILHGVSLELPQGQVLALLGRNGAGKTTTLKTIMGLISPQEGQVLLQGQALHGLAPHQIARQGLAYVPETRDIFPSLSVRENLELAIVLNTPQQAQASSPWTLERVLTFFPRLQERLNNGGDQLSGGEQQMLSIARALLMNPRLLILDEPTEGLAPIIIGQIHAKLLELKAAGLTILLVEQNFGFAVSLADQVCILGRGRIQWQGTGADIQADREAQHQWLGV